MATINAGMKTLLSGTLLLVTATFVSAVPAPDLSRRFPPIGEKYCGPEPFCQTLSRGSGINQDCLPIPDGCCITVPAGNRVPPLECPTPQAEALRGDSGPESPPEEESGAVKRQATNPPPKEQFCGPEPFCQTLSHGSGGVQSCTPIPDGCCITVPSGNSPPGKPICPSPDQGPEDGGLEGRGPKDHGPKDHGPEDGGLEDGGLEDGGLEDGGPEDGGPEEGGPEDGGPEDGGPEDGGPEDDGPEDGGPEDCGAEDGGPEDCGAEDDGPEDDGSENGA
ncbi:MAG: hypothetical protein M1813_000127 [Trichoglossum hirsutum]|nr:MAG: hypothetical protein M1813_000127 [Trichoglossum hirsutum]